jgi:hypothetical protein
MPIGSLKRIEQFTQRDIDFLGGPYYPSGNRRPLRGFLGIATALSVR